MKALNKYFASILACLFTFSGGIPAIAENNIKNQPTVTFSLIKNDKNTHTFTAKLVLTHLEGLSPTIDYLLAFNSMKTLASIDRIGGDLYTIKLPLTKDAKEITLILKGKTAIRNVTDVPAGYFLIDTTHQKVLAIAAKTILPPKDPVLADDEAKQEEIKANTAIEGNPVATTLRVENSLIVPLPVELQRHPGQFVLNQHTQILYQDKMAQAPAAFFAKAIEPATGYQLTIKQYQHQQPLPNTILLTHEGTHFLTAQQQAEGYLLEVTPSYIVIHALSTSGYFYGLQSLRQLLPPSIYSPQRQPATTWLIPCVNIRDYPRFEYRGLHLDVARHFMAIKEVKRLLDLMSIHKLNYFEWHLSDDEGWRIEIKRYPTLTTIGAWRGYDPKHISARDLLPAYGSGAKPYGGYYSQEEIRDIVKYAEARHITIVPEIDMPGHARAMIMSLPNELIDSQDASHYTSIQGYPDNVLSPCNQATFTVIDNILSEVAPLFPGKYIHVGGDEVPANAWRNSCMAKKYDPNNPHFSQLVENDFLKKVQQMIGKKNKIMAGWDEIARKDGTLAAPLLVYLWNADKNTQVYSKSAREGYKMIMAPATNLYFDFAYNGDPSEPGQYWAGYIDTFSAYSLQPIKTIAGQSDAVIKGVQGQLWSELIDSPERLEYFAFPRMAGLAELAWTPAKRRNWQNFSARMHQAHRARLDNYGVHYRKMEFS